MVFYVWEREDFLSPFVSGHLCGVEDSEWDVGVDVYCLGTEIDVCRVNRDEEFEG